MACGKSGHCSVRHQESLKSSHTSTIDPTKTIEVRVQSQGKSQRQKQKIAREVVSWPLMQLARGQRWAWACFSFGLYSQC